MSVAPKDWLNCPKKSYLIAGKFVAFKTPLDQKFTKKLKKTDIFTPDDVFEWLAKSKLNLGLWIDLTKTTRYFDSIEVTKRGCQYQKIWCEGHGSVPNWNQVQTFMNTIDQFIAESPDKIIAVHCTHGYNRTGYLIVTYLVKRMHFHIDDALKAFSKGRPPGIYREAYVEELIHRYHGDLSKHIIMKPFWTKTEVEIPIKGSDDMSRVIVPKDELSTLDRTPVPGKVLCHLGKSPSHSQYNDRLGNSFVQSDDTYKAPRTYNEEDRRAANRRRWKNFDRKRREKRKRDYDNDRNNYRSESYENHSYKRSRSSYDYDHRSNHNSYRNQHLRFEDY